MNEPQVEKHLQAVRRELRVRAWSAPRVDAAFRDLAFRRSNDLVFRRRAARIGAVALAAAAVALLFVAFRAVRPGTEQPAEVAGIAAPALERLALGDGMEARFTKGARLDVREKTPARVVVSVAAGTAHFRVRHDPHRVFRVVAGDVELEDLGTAFEVEHQESAVRVSVSEGSVAVSFLEGGEGKRQSARLNAGESAVYPSSALRSQRTVVAPAPPSDAPVPMASGQSPGGSTLIQSATDWRELARAGKHQQAYELIAPGGFRDVRNDASDQLLASDVARLSRHPADAAMLLRKLLATHARDARAPSAAFTLGWVLMNELKRPREAALAFAQAEALAPRGNLAEDAVARAVEAWHRAGEQSRAKAEVERYRKTYPQGRHRAMLERLVITP